MYEYHDYINNHYQKYPAIKFDFKGVTKSNTFNEFLENMKVLIKGSMND